MNLVYSFQPNVRKIFIKPLCISLNSQESTFSSFFFALFSLFFSSFILTCFILIFCHYHSFSFSTCTIYLSIYLSIFLFRYIKTNNVFYSGFLHPPFPISLSHQGAFFIESASLINNGCDSRLPSQTLEITLTSHSKPIAFQWHHVCITAVTSAQVPRVQN